MYQKVEQKLTYGFGKRVLSAKRWQLVVDHWDLGWWVLARSGIPVKDHEEVFSNYILPALVRAARNFNPRRAKFTTLVVLCCRQHLWKYKRELARERSRCPYRLEDLVGSNEIKDLLSEKEPEVGKALETREILDLAQRYVGARDWAILKSYYERKCTLKEIAKVFNLTVEGVRQTLITSKVKIQKKMRTCMSV